MSGSAGGGGYEYQAEAFAFVASCALAGQRLGWFEDLDDIPVALAVETHGPGDDLNIELAVGALIELQAKHGLSKDRRFWDAMLRLARGLNTDAALRGVLLVDSSTSRTIRNPMEFAGDVIRLGQGRKDGLKPITVEVLERLEREGIRDLSLFARLRVITKDLAEGSDGLDAAVSLLRPVVESPASAHTAWEILTREGLRLIRQRGRRDVRALARLLQTRVKLSATCTNDVVVAEGFLDWVIDNNREFLVPDLGVRMPITEAWNQLRELEDQSLNAYGGKEALAKAIERYHEWERLAEGHLHGPSVSAEDAVASVGRMVVTGGPGIGKSTLQRRLAYQMATQGKTVLRAPLRPLHALLTDGRTFEESLLLLATDKSGVSYEAARRTLSSPACLLADGLDECDPNRTFVAEQLVEWSNGHPDCFVVVTTRPTGHHPSLLPGFQHMELAPLDDVTLAQLSQKLLAETTSSRDEPAPYWSEFFQQVAERRRGSQAASLAARNPMLLTFLIRLFIDGQPLDGKRAELYGRILELVRTRKSTDRSLDSDVDNPIAQRAIEIIGWLSIESPTARVQDIADIVAKDLSSSMGLAPLEAQQAAERSMIFWEQRGLVERVSVGSLDALTFVQTTFGEFAAACYLKRMPEDGLASLLAKASRDPRWRQPILLCSGLGDVERITRLLLEYDDPNDPNSIEAVLAAAAIAEAHEPGDTIVSAVAGRLTQRLASSIPLIAIEAAEALCDLAPLAPEVVGPVGNVLLDHEQPWTRAAAELISIAAGPDYFSFEQTRAWLDRFWATAALALPRRPPGVGDTLPQDKYMPRERMLRLALSRLFSGMGREDVDAYIETCADVRDLSAATASQLLEALTTHGYSHVAARISQGYAGRAGESISSVLQEGARRSREALIAFVSAVLTATVRKRSPTASDADSSCAALGALFAGMGFWKAILPDWHLLAVGEEVEAFREVLRGVILALDIDETQLADEAMTLLSRLPAQGSLFGCGLPHVPVKPDWPRALDGDLDPTKLVRALYHPSRPVVATATNLLEAGVGGERSRELLTEVLMEGLGVALEAVASMAGAIWGEEAVSVLLDRLESEPTVGCEHLYIAAAQLAKGPERERVLEVALRDLPEVNPQVAAGAAQAVKILQPERTSQLVDRLRVVWEHSASHPSWCDRCENEAEGDSCPNCHIGCPSPRPALVSELSRLKALDLDALLALRNDMRHDVKRAAKQAVVDLAIENDSMLAEIVRRLGLGQAPLEILDALLTQEPEILRQHRATILSLLDSELSAVRARVVSALGGSWIERAEAEERASRALRDPDPVVRDKATKVLRILTRD